MLSVMVLGAGAAFSDQADIENTEAVNMCSALNIIGGYEDGTFHPERNIKRSEVTKMICVALNGGKEPNVSTNAVPTFNDVRGTADAWAEGYIESCVAQGIVSGVGGGRFSPAGNVTGAQLAKMLLVCLGYDASIEGFTGNAWETNVNVRAAQKHLYEGLESMDTSAAITRDNAAQMVWNAMNAYEVEYKTTVVTDENGNLVTQNVAVDKVVLSTNDKITLLEDKYEVGVNVGTLTEIDGKTLRIVMSDSDKADSSDENLVTFLDLDTDYSSLLGQKVKVMYKKNNDVLGVYATGDNTVVTANQKDIDVDSGKLNINGTNYTLESDGVTLYIDGAVTADKYKAGDFTDSQSASVLTFVDSDGNDKIDTAWETTYEVGKVTYVSSSQVIIGGKTYKAEEENIDSNLAKDDWAIITHDLYNSNLDIVKADVATGTVTATKDKTGGWTQYQIGETWYNETASANGDVQSNVKAGVDVEYVQVNGILFYAKKTSATTDHLSDVLFVAYHGTDGLANNQARVMFPNGDEATIDLKNTYVEDQNGGNAGAIANGMAYEYYKSGAKYQLVTLNTAEDAYGDYSMIVDADASGNVELTNTSGKIASVEGITIDDGADVIVFTAKGTTDPDAKTYSVKHITGKQLKQFAAVAAGTNGNTSIVENTIAAFKSDVNGLTRATALFVTFDSNDGSFHGAMDNLSAYANYAFITDDAQKVGNDQIKFTIWTGTEELVVYADQTNETKFKTGTIIGYDSITAGDDGKNIIDDAFPIPTGNVTASSITSARNDGEKFTIQGVGEVDVDDFSTVLYVNTSDDKTIGVTDGKATAAHDPLKDGETLATNILYYNREVAVIDVNEIAGETYATNKLFDYTSDGTVCVNEIADFSSVQWINNRTGDTDNDNAYDNAQMTLTFYSKAAGTLTLSGVKGGTKTLDVVAGSNKFEDIYVTGNVTATWSATGTPSTSDVVLEKAGYVDAGLKYGSNTETSKLTFTVENGAAQIPTISFGTAGADNAKFTATLKDGSGNTATLVPSDARTAFYYEIVCANATVTPGTYTATISVDGQTITQDIVVAKDKVTAATITSFTEATNSNKLSTYNPGSLTGTLTPAGATSTVTPVVDKDKCVIANGDKDTIATGDTIVVTITVELTDANNYEFASNIATGDITLSGASDTTVSNVAIVNGDLVITATTTVA